MSHFNPTVGPTGVRFNMLETKVRFVAPYVPDVMLMVYVSDTYKHQRHPYG